jgi:uncharacterized protein YodC (DUF2158 family)
MMNANKISIGDRVRIKSTGQEVTIEQISQHGFSIIKFNSGGKHRFLNTKLEPVSANRVAMN